MREKIICIGGGVGPMAGVELHKKIIENTKTNGTDQDHPDVYHLSRSHDIGDRTEYLLNIIDENPAYGMYRTLKILMQEVNNSDKTLVVGIPCNTFHSPEIFDLFTHLINEAGDKAKILNMIEETGLFIKNHYKHVKKVGLLSTTGTRKVKVYDKIFNSLGFKLIEVPEEMQSELHDSIYNLDWGIKAKSPVSNRSRDNFLRYSELLIKEGAELIIQGCTEIPLALPELALNGISYVDPMWVLARALIREAAPDKLKKIKKTGK